jgi:hypothetical protein
MRLLLLPCFLFVSTLLHSQDQNLKTAESVIKFFPSVALQNPLSDGSLGLLILGGCIQDKTRIANQADANAEAYIGLGYPEKWVGLGVTFNIHGLTNNIGEQNNLGSGTASFHINRFLFDKKLLLDAGVDNAFGWGGNKVFRQYITYQRSFYVSGNYLFYTKQQLDKAFSYVSLTLGAGNGYFRHDNNYSKEKSGSPSPFISLATPVMKATNLIAEWNGYDVGIGLSSIPFQKVPFLFRVEATDFVYGKVRFVSSISFPLLLQKKEKISAGRSIRPVGLKAVRPARTI